MGALTSKPFSFTSRSWELLDRITYDYTDTFFSSIKVNFRGNSIMRILPEIEQISLSEWISDRTRFAYDNINSLKIQDVFFNFKINNFSSFCLRFFFKRFSNFYVSYNYLDISSAVRLKNWNFFVGSTFFSAINCDFRNNFYSDFVSLSNSMRNYRSFFLIGLNLRYTLPVFSVSIRRQKLFYSSFIFNLGFFTNNLLDEFNVGSSKSDLINFLNFSSRLSKFFCKNISTSIIFTNPNLYDFVTTKFYFFTKTYSFFAKPSLLATKESGYFNNSNFNFIKLSAPHPFTFISYNLRSSSYQKFDSLFSSVYYGNIILFFGKSISKERFFENLPFSYNVPSIFQYSNFYTHFYDIPNSISSLNLLIATKRHIDNRSNFNYYF